jgi:AraC-like DNA-binding protein
MPGSSTSSLTDADAYQAELGDLFAAFIVVSPVAFTAHVTRVTLRHLHLLRVQESLSRVAYVSLPPEQALISFSSDPSLSLVWRGLTLQPDEIMFHGRAERLHQRTAGPSCWGGIALSAASLAAFTKIETGRTLALPESGRILRPLPRDRKHLLHVHREAAHLADKRPHVLAHPEAGRAMEEELAGVLVACLTDGEIRPETEAMRRGNEIMVRFEDELATFPNQNMHPADLCSRLGVSAHTLGQFCAAFLGLSAANYVRRRRLNLVRAAIVRRGSQGERIAELARHGGFTKHSRFAAHYRAAFGETPSMTLRRAREV